MMSFSDIPLSFWGYALETATLMLNRAPSKSVVGGNETYGIPGNPFLRLAGRGAAQRAGLKDQRGGIFT